MVPFFSPQNGAFIAAFFLSDETNNFTNIPFYIDGFA